jgi:hypothetical protein
MLYAPCSALLSGMEKVKAGERESRSVMGTYNIMYVPQLHDGVVLTKPAELLGTA